jgi:hypothetical protein
MASTPAENTRTQPLIYGKGVLGAFKLLGIETTALVEWYMCQNFSVIWQHWVLI